MTGSGTSRSRGDWKERRESPYFRKRALGRKKSVGAQYQTGKPP